MKKNLTLCQAIEVMKKIKENDFNDEFNCFFEGNGGGEVKFIIENKAILI
jgi:hypothetical protein